MRYCPFPSPPSVIWYYLFHFQALSDENGKRKGIYNHPVIQKAVNKMWFKNKRDEGIIYQDYFKPLPIPSIALILTAVSILILGYNLSYIHLYLYCFRLNVTLMSGQLGSRPTLHFMQKSTARFMIATSSPFLNLGSIRNQETWTCSVGYNANYITSACRFNFFLIFISISTGLSVTHPKVTCRSLNNWASTSCGHSFLGLCWCGGGIWGRFGDRWWGRYVRGPVVCFQTEFHIYFFSFQLLNFQIWCQRSSTVVL